MIKEKKKSEVKVFLCDSSYLSIKLSPLTCFPKIYFLLVELPGIWVHMCMLYVNQCPQTEKHKCQVLFLLNINKAGILQILTHSVLINDPMRQILLHFTDAEIWLEMTLSQNTSTWFLSNLILIPNLII